MSVSVVIGGEIKKSSKIVSNSQGHGEQRICPKETLYKRIR